ncbi:MAG: hypothetical protein M3500_03695 [Actinomycetota bacterium]|nr:hypothetical protein [Actinomycetota bacterium]
MSLYWRPPRFAAAVVVADAPVWEGAGDQLLESLQWNADDAQFFLRALLFRAVTDLLHRPHEEPSSVTRATLGWAPGRGAVGGSHVGHQQAVYPLADLQAVAGRYGAPAHDAAAEYSGYERRLVDAFIEVQLWSDESVLQAMQEG